MKKPVDIIPVIFRAKDRLPIDFQDGLSVKEILLDSKEGSRAIGHTGCQF